MGIVCVFDLFCEVCGWFMVFDDIEEFYFVFVGDVWFTYFCSGL